MALWSLTLGENMAHSSLKPARASKNSSRLLSQQSANLPRSGQERTLSRAATPGQGRKKSPSERRARAASPVTPPGAAPERSAVRRARVGRGTSGVRERPTSPHQWALGARAERLRKTISNSTRDRKSRIGQRKRAAGGGGAAGGAGALA